MGIVLGSVRGGRVARNAEVEIAKIGIIGREQDADIPGNPGEDEGPGAQVFEQEIQSRREKSRMFRLQDEIIVGARGQLLDQGAAEAAVLQAMIDLGAEV